MNLISTEIQSDVDNVFVLDESVLEQAGGIPCLSSRLGGRGACTGGATSFRADITYHRIKRIVDRDWDECFS